MKHFLRCVRRAARRDGAVVLIHPTFGANLLRTAGGRWALHYWSSRQGAKPTYKFINSKQAREWALANEDEDVLTRFFADPPEEIGPDLG